LFTVPLCFSENSAHHFKALSGIFFPTPIPEGPKACITYPKDTPEEQEFMASRDVFR
jgi:hypothetical protein